MSCRLINPALVFAVFGIFFVSLCSAQSRIVSIRPTTMVEGETVHLQIDGSGFVSGQTKLLTNSTLRILGIRVLSPSSLDATAVAGPSGTATVQVSTSSAVSASVSVSVVGSRLGLAKSVTPTYLAGRTASTVSPDGIGSSAYINLAIQMTG